MRIGILEPDDFSSKALALLNQIGLVELFPGNGLDHFLENKDALFIRLNFIVDSSFLDCAPKLKYLCSPTTGLNHIDLNATSLRNVRVVSLRGETAFLENIRATPEHAVGLTLALLRNYGKAFQSGKNAVWNRDLHKGYELFENKIGIVGFGRIGRLLARYFRAFGSQVFFYDIKKNLAKEDGVVKMDSIRELIENVNIVLLTASYSENNAGFFGRNYLEMLGEKYFINISRGELVDETCLMELIENNFFKGVALDVLSAEGDDNNFHEFAMLAEDHNLIVTPHIGGATYNSMARTEEFIAAKLIREFESGS